MNEVLTSLPQGAVFALFGAALAAIGGGIGSSFGISYAGQTSAGVAAEKPEAAGSLIVLTALPGSQAIYGLIGAFLVIQFFGTGFTEMTNAVGLQILAACLPLAVAALFSAIMQGKIAAAGTNIVAKHPSKAGSAISLAVIVETVAIFGLLITILMLNSIKATLPAA